MTTTARFPTQTLLTSLTRLGAVALLASLVSPAFAQTGTGSGTGSGTNARPPARDGAAPPREGRPAGREGRPAGRDGRPAGEGQAPAPTVKIGEAAPAFTLVSAVDEKSVSLADYKGKFVVLQWINPDCPYCVRVMEDGTVAKAQAEANKAAGGEVVWLFINSTHYMPPEGTKEYLAKHRSDKPGLVDRDGTVGKRYDAKTTPHVYVIDPEGVLRYHGAISDDMNGAKTRDKQEVTLYAVNAITQAKAGETVAPDYVRPWGCSVKYPPAAVDPNAPRRDAGGRGQAGKGADAPQGDPRRNDPNQGRPAVPGGLGNQGGTTR
ncbi:MAG TPA: redoxin domain-containing protein [Phycisphaerales bacterium]|nr:redoxin domain-containing protein [Phycisphaerales bacterium]HMP38481.1 redoxin domain-containing protein [Phycisphaerales bacterium]